MELRGKVKSGFGNASFWVGKISRVFEAKYHRKLFLGTLNIELEEEYILEDGDILKASEYGGQLDVFVKECKILGHRCFIVRPEVNNRKGGAHPLTIIEVVADCSLRELGNLKDGDEIMISI